MLDYPFIILPDCSGSASNMIRLLFVIGLFVAATCTGDGDVTGVLPSLLLNQDYSGHIGGLTSSGVYTQGRRYDRWEGYSPRGIEVRKGDVKALERNKEDGKDVELGYDDRKHGDFNSGYPIPELVGRLGLGLQRRDLLTAGYKFPLTLYQLKPIGYRNLVKNFDFEPLKN